VDDAPVNGGKSAPLLERRTELWHPNASILTPGATPHVTRRSEQDCPVDHAAAERAVETLPSPVRRGVYFAIGWVSVAAGVIGIVVPVWPTTCFLLLAGWCFARSSERAERWLHENRLFGRYISDYRERGVISPRIRLASVVTLWLFIGASAILVSGRLWLVGLLLLVAGAVTLHLYSLPAAGPVATK